MIWVIRRYDQRKWQGIEKPICLHGKVISPSEQFFCQHQMTILPILNFFPSISFIHDFWQSTHGIHCHLSSNVYALWLILNNDAIIIYLSGKKCEHDVSNMIIHVNWPWKTHNPRRELREEVSEKEKRMI